MTHDELRDYIDKFDAAGMVTKPAVKALRAVVELHKPEGPNVQPLTRCVKCMTTYPCAEIQAIEKELS